MLSYTHITSEQINEVVDLKRNNILQKDIALTLGKTSSAISQEIKRNLTKDGKYYAKVAKENRKERRLKANQRFKKIENSEWLQKHIEEYLKKHWSPEQISGRLKIDYPNKKNKLENIVFTIGFIQKEKI